MQNAAKNAPTAAAIWRWRGAERAANRDHSSNREASSANQFESKSRSSTTDGHGWTRIKDQRRGAEDAEKRKEFRGSFIYEFHLTLRLSAFSATPRSSALISAHPWLMIKALATQDSSKPKEKNRAGK